MSTPTPASFPPTKSLPSPSSAAQHIAAEARTLLASLRGGPPHVARGELAAGLHNLRGLVRSTALEGVSTSVGGDGIAAVDGRSAMVHDAAPADSALGDVRLPPPSSPTKRESYVRAADSRGEAAASLPPPPPLSSTADLPDDADSNDGLGDKYPDAEPLVHPECPSTPTAAQQTLPLLPPEHPNTPTPHAVPFPGQIAQTLIEEWPRNTTSEPALPRTNTNNTTSDANPSSKPNDPGPYASPFLAVIIDPRAAGPHTLVALRALHRLIERGSIVQWCTAHDASGPNVHSAYPFYTHLEAVALGVLACRFEQTDAGADEAVEMAIADLLGLIIEYDAAGARSVGNLVLKHAREKKRKGVAVHPVQSSSSSSSSSCQSQQPVAQSLQGNKGIRIPRLPASVIMEAFHAVFVTRQTFVRGGIHVGHYSPALSNHFEQVLMRMIHCVFWGEDDGHLFNVSRQIRASFSSRHVGAAKAILEFLVDQILGVTLRGESGEGNSHWMEGGVPIGQYQDGRALCLRLIQCCIKTGWGRGEMSDGVVIEEDGALLRVVEDDLCLALLTTGQAIWAEDGQYNGSAPVSTEVVSEVCSTLSLLWSLSCLRTRLHSQFMAIFSGFYQRALSLLRKRPFPEDGMAFQSNIIFDLEVEIILESLVDILCLHGGSSLSTLEELFGTYDCSMTELDIASGLLVELSLCCGGSVDEDGEVMLVSAPLSKTASSGTQTPLSKESGPKGGSLRQKGQSVRPVPDHLKVLCAQALLGSLKQLFREPEQMNKIIHANITSSQIKESEITDTCNGSLRRAKERKRVLHNAAKLFNEKPTKGIQYLLDHDIFTDPVTPESVSSFLRNGLVVGLDKAAVGQYLGEKGKASSPDKNHPVWDSEWFHKEVLAAFCSSFAFEHQSLLDGLRMFLATFRLPGEAQMIDRILQGFAESCGCSCEESVNGSLKLFSTDEKRASDAAYLLSFSIIMLNTDLHNDNIRPDRKMKVNDFVKNNTNYGKEISDKDLPREYLEGLYNNIKENQIRTLGEGADGSMTIERWKDVMSGSSSQPVDFGHQEMKDLKELLLESSWRPIFSAISGLWGMNRFVETDDEGFELIRSGRLQSSRLGIDMAYELLSGASGRPDIFQDLFTHICLMTGLLGDYSTSPDERSYEFLQSVERQSALIVAMKVCLEHGDVVGLDGWKCVWGMVFELRDLQLLSARSYPKLMAESDADLLSIDARQEFSRRMTKGDAFEDHGRPRQGMGLFGSLFRSASSSDNIQYQMQGLTLSVHFKEAQLLWDDFASSDEDDDDDFGRRDSDSFTPRNLSPIGVAFHNRFVEESASGEHDTPITGLERMDSARTDIQSLRARVRQRLAQLIDFFGLISESRFFDSSLGLSDAVNALVEIIHDASKQGNVDTCDGPEVDDSYYGLPLSPASEALAEILLCEITLKNKDRFAMIWENVLGAHYNSRLSIKPSKESDDHSETIKLTPGIEKCVTSVLRLCAFAVNRNIPITSQVLATLNILHPPLGALFWSPLELNLDKHLSEGIWRICQSVEGLSQVSTDGWEGILGVLEWCASRGGLRYPDRPGILADDDPSLQAFRSLHLLLHASELKDSVPFSVVTSIRCLVEAGERANSTRLSIAGLDLLQVLHLRLESSLGVQSMSGRNHRVSTVSESKLLASYWLPILEAIGEPAEKSRNTSVRQQAISLLTDALLDRHGTCVPESTICGIIEGISVPLAGKRITDLLRTRHDENDFENTMDELELCIGLLFKPLLHHLKTLLSVESEFLGIWISLLGIMTQLLGDEPYAGGSRIPGAIMTRESLLQRTKELGSEHLRNAIMVLSALGVLAEEGSDAEISSVTWAAIGSIGYCKPLIDEWKQSARGDTKVVPDANAEV
ncbi:hypothetical protein HJC23_006363 [Cyclotella cryptica]|uniref:SEC7 domain-containing protein n=1 Tax=Cyclotella cryptica TaxID=29204 RepID=A0ABD3Q3Y3_9STRA|eukprot:CCRYP_008767-RA/>CCRYP_008767-RA protein AED:0.01 eAED:0.01 QI:181/1/1/1/1/1/3/349/1875